MNDRSTDRTGEILGRLARALPDLIVIDGVEPPAGWTGKIHALHQGQARATGEWLVFADADTRHEPSSVRSCIAHALARENDVLCVVPRRELAVPSEKTLLPMPLHLFELQSPLARANDPGSPESACVGQLILATRAAYDRLGGWESVKGDVMDDRAFGQRAKAPSSGVRYGKADGARVSSVRLYESLADVWEGGTKTNWHRTWPLALVPFAVLVTLALGVGPLALAALATVHPHPWFGPVALAQLGLFAIVWVQAVRRAGIALAWALLQALAYPFTAASILVAGVQLATGRGVRWKGRRYS